MNKIKQVAYFDNQGVHHMNGVRLGDVVCDVDGYYKFFPEVSRGGYWSPEVMRGVADLMDSINKEWDDVVQSDPAINGDT